MIRVEFHCHSLYSRDCLTSLETLLRVSQHKGIDRLVITDHNTITGALEARKMDPHRVIVGEEIMTTGGELLCAFVQDEVPAGLSPMETIERLREQGAFIAAAHPFDRTRKGHWPLPILLDIIPYLDAIETFNSRCVLPGFNRQAVVFARQHSLQAIVGSDAHTALEVGRATMLMPDFDDASGFKKSIRQASFHARFSSPLVHIASRYAVWRKRLLSS